MTQTAEIDRFSNWLAHRTGKCVVAGPCSVESEEQILETAKELAQHEVTLLRGGIWKPRTRPGSYEGIGEKGLGWLKAAGRAAGLPVATEVALPSHVDQCLRAGIDVLWIGARTTTSPIAVQSIADSLAGTDIPVMIKNPMNPDLGLWIGAIERMRRAGIKRIVAIHRGFSTHIQHKYRNQPLWSIPLQLRRRMPEIPILCDPSHICGTQQYIGSVAESALKLGFDGLMIESHWRPESALSDPGQQLSPAQLAELVGRALHNANSDTAIRNQELENLWMEIDEIDQDLTELLSKRLSILRQTEACQTDENEISRNTRANISATRFMTEVVEQLPRCAGYKRKADVPGRSGSGRSWSGDSRLGACFNEADQQRLQSTADPCRDSVVAQTPA